MTNPLLSIVIANYNYGRFLESAIRSVISQDMGDEVELIVCDAASTDNSVEIIKKYENKIAWWCSEKDGGQSAAFNKGFSHAHGKWLTWLNADDVYFPGTLKAFARFIARHPNAKWVTGNKMHFDNCTGRIVRVHWGPNIMPPFLSGNHASSGVFGPTSFWRHDVYAQLGGIDERMHYAMDTEYWARLTMAGVRQMRLRRFCWAFRDHAESKTSGEQAIDVVEKRKKETEYWRRKTGYTYRHDFSNPWYWLWVLWRLIDGSFLQRQAFLLLYKGRMLPFCGGWLTKDKT